ncbi:MAG TPA: glycosyltransferase family 4 protein [Candidatus Acidoferrales bacterium]|nr:glycosyltransferase family 4 protein [Candidatus Acidoferrales bacterium]
MAILVITWNFPPKQGGMERLMGELCASLRTSRSVFVIGPWAGAARGDENRVYRPPLGGLAAFFAYAFIKGFLVLRQTRKIEFVLGGSALVAPLVVVLARLFRVKALVYAHGLDLVYPSRWYQLFCVRWLRRCDRVICNSRHTASLALSKGVGRASIEVIPPGVNLPCRGSKEGAKRELGLARHKVVLYAGRLVRRKGVVEFLRHCFPAIAARVADARFVIVGGNPVQSLVHHENVLGEITGCIRELRLEQRVALAGWLTRDELAKFYLAADVLVLPALAMKDDVEGFGIVILEAAAAGTPCVATRVGGIPDAIEGGKTGILVDPGNYDQMAEAIIGLLSDEHLRQTFGASCRAQIAQRFDWSKIVARYEELFSSLGG